MFSAATAHRLAEISRSLTSGSAFVYDRHQGGLNQWGWSRSLRPTAPGGSGDGFGLSVALNGDLILVGA